MITNLFSKLPGLKHLGDDSPEREEADAKRARIEYHRKHVRNGPVRTRSLTTGQMRRIGIRDTERAQRKAFKQQKRAFFAAQHEAAVLRSHLQRVGVVAWGNPETTSTVEQIARSITWLVQKFPPAESAESGITLQSLTESLQQAYDRYADLHGQPSKKIEVNPDLFATA